MSRHSGHYVEQYDGHTIVYDEGPASWGAYVEDMPVCVAVADTREQVEEAIRWAIVSHSAALACDMAERPWLYGEQAEAAHA
jgi:predicted RNase H-like HicB family nuclease